MKIPFLKAKEQQTRSPDSPPRSGQAMAKTVQYQQTGFMPFAYLPRKFEQTRQLDITHFKYYSLNDLLDLLRYNHPETSFAIWQFLRVANSGIEFDAKKVTGEHSDRGQKVLDSLLFKLNHPPLTNQFEQARGIDLVTGQLLLNAMMRGGCGCELVLNSLGKMDRLQVFDSGTLYFQTENNRLVPYQKQLTTIGTGTGFFTKIDYPTIFYNPLDPSADDPYGSSPLVSLIQIVAWQIQFLSDLQAAVHSTGYPRMDATLMEEIAVKNMPSYIQSDPAKQKEWFDRIRTDVETMLTNLEPDSIPVHWDSLKLDLIGKGSSQ